MAPWFLGWIAVGNRDCDSFDEKLREGGANGSAGQYNPRSFRAGCPKCSKISFSFAFPRIGNCPPPTSKEIRGHLAAGKYAARLGLTWNDRIAFVLTDKLQLKRLEFLELGKDDAEAEERDAAEQFEIDFAVMAGELTGLLEDLALVLRDGPEGALGPLVRSKVA